MPDNFRRIGFVSTRISGTDGVSLEIGKWSDILQELDRECFYIAGECDRPSDRTRIIERANFLHPDIQEINHECFGRRQRSPLISSKITDLAKWIKIQLYDAIKHLELDLLIIENALTVPMNIPLGVALVEVMLETSIACIAHHHDFVWERERFRVNAVNDYILGVFPPQLGNMQHVAINTLAGEEFSRRTGLSCRVIPNVMDFANPPPPPDEYSSDLREAIGISPDDILIIQPTRVVERKGIEHSIELVRRLNDPRCKLVITHSGGDEGYRYARRIREFAALLGVEILFVEDIISEERGMTADGRKQYTVWDIYQQADLVTYPSSYEGFGNAFLEAVYFHKPVVCNRYAIYQTDIEPCGMRPIIMAGFLTQEVIDEVWKVLNDDQYRCRMVEENYQIASRYFSYSRAKTSLAAMLHEMASFRLV